ncbi:hypothetical protein BC829DRAFT_395040 [Chytridium lagenaria]|nr:hypothetical protein BC829DRAFT_395040 [Chytridium lagenaria]
MTDADVVIAGHHATPTSSSPRLITILSTLRHLAAPNFTNPHLNILAKKPYTFIQPQHWELSTSDPDDLPLAAIHGTALLHRGVYDEADDMTGNGDDDDNVPLAVLNASITTPTVFNASTNLDKPCITPPQHHHLRRRGNSTPTSPTPDFDEDTLPLAHLAARHPPPPYVELDAPIRGRQRDRRPLLTFTEDEMRRTGRGGMVPDVSLPPHYVALGGEVERGRGTVPRGLGERL